MAESDEVSGAALVRIQPAECEISVPSGMPLMKAALAIGIRWPNVCKGQAQCGVCAVEVVEGYLSAIEPRQRELQMLERLTQRPQHGGVMRLACQLQAAGPITVIKLGVRAPKPPD